MANGGQPERGGEKKRIFLSVCHLHLFPLHSILHVSSAVSNSGCRLNCPLGVPDIVIASRQRLIRYDHARLVLLVKNAMPLCMEVAAKLGGTLFDLDQIECTVVGQRTMARVHREFLDIRGTTDVITFPYGEILVCASVAGARAREFGHDVTTELALYCIHGLLHLAGHDDATPDSARLMSRAQMKILKAASNTNPTV